MDEKPVPTKDKTKDSTLLRSTLLRYSSSSSSSSSSVSNDSTKRKRDSKSEGGDIEVGMRVKSKFDDVDCYEGSVTNVKRKRSGEVYKISIQYDDGDGEECNWPDEDIIVVGRGRELVGEKKTKKGGSGVYEIGGIGDGRVNDNKLEERIFSCGEPGCEYF